MQRRCHLIPPTPPPAHPLLRAEYDKECKICARPFTVFCWRPARDARYKKTEICQTCCKLKNICQVCLLDLEYGLPVQVRATAPAINSNDAIPRSDVNRGVTPKNGETERLSFPVFKSVAEANAETKANASIVYAPPPFAAAAVMEVLEAELDRVVYITEGIPQHDMLHIARVLSCWEDYLALVQRAT